MRRSASAPALAGATPGDAPSGVFASLRRLCDISPKTVNLQRSHSGTFPAASPTLRSAPLSFPPRRRKRWRRALCALGFAAVAALACGVAFVAVPAPAALPPVLAAAAAAQQQQQQRPRPRPRWQTRLANLGRRFSRPRPEQQRQRLPASHPIAMFERSTKILLAADTKSGVLAKEFVQAIDEVLPIFPMLGVAFGILHRLVDGDVAKLKRATLAARGHVSDRATVAELLARDAALGYSGRDSSAFVSALWLSRSMGMMDEIFTCLAKDDGNDHGDSQACTALAYESTLRPYHGRIVQAISRRVLLHTPSLPDVIRKFRLSDQDAERIAPTLRAWVAAADPVLLRLDGDFARYPALRDAKV
jgi:hypothetical protein